MADQQERTNHENTKRESAYDPLMDTQRLLLGVEPPAEDDFRLEDILAEYGGRSRPASDAPEGKDPAPPADSPAAEASPAAEKTPSKRKVVPFPAPPVPEPEAEKERAEEKPAAALRPDNEIDVISPEDLFGLPRREEEQWEELSDAEEMEPEPETPPADQMPEDGEPAEEVSLEDVVASTVEAVQEEQERRREKLRRRLEKERKKRAPKPVKRREPSARHPLPPTDNEPSLRERASYHKSRYYACRKSMLLSLPVLALLWLPWVLTRFGVEVPFFSDSPGNAALCVLIPQVLYCMLCWPVFRATAEGLRERSCTVCFFTALANVVTILDEATLLLLPQRAQVAPLGGVAAVAACFTLLGLVYGHRGMWETFRVAALGRPSYIVDCCDYGIAKGRGSSAGFYTRAAMEDTATQWQRLLLPALAAASLVFAVLASVGQGRSQDLLWCWSVILCAGSALVAPLVYHVPFGRLAVRLGRDGAAVAGQYGAAALTASRQLVVTDDDLFPQGTVALNGLKLYGEERNRAISYAATLAVQAGGCLARVFGDICRTERIEYQPLEHFHIHDDNGLSGMIHGETVLVGTPAFMRHMAVRLPVSLPGKTVVCLAVDGELTAVFSVKYNTNEPVESALRALGRNGLQLTLAVRDGNITPKLLKTRFGADGSAHWPELSERLALSDPEREMDAPNGLLYREGLYPFVDMVAGSRRLCQTVRLGTLLTMLSSVFGVLVGFYLTFTASYAVLTPVLLLTYLLLWVAPMLPMLWSVDKT